MSKFRFVLFFLVLLLAGYWLYHHFQQPAGHRKFHLRPDKISKSLQIQIAQTFHRLHTPLNQHILSEEVNLRELWEAAKKQHQKGSLTPEEAQEVSRKLKELIRMNKERQELVLQLREINRQNHNSRLNQNSTVNGHARRETARQNLLRQWEEWKSQNVRRYP